MDDTPDPLLPKTPAPTTHKPFYVSDEERRGLRQLYAEAQRAEQQYQGAVRLVMLREGLTDGVYTYDPLLGVYTYSHDAGKTP